MTRPPGPNGHPYYILAPPYTRTSAGTRCLHTLCHQLKLSGFEAYLYLMKSPLGTVLNANLATPLLTQAIVDRHLASRLQPIAVYPEIIAGNPFNARCVARYILNYPGLLGGPESFDSQEILFAYSKQFGERCGCPDQLLEVPLVDQALFHPQPVMPRKGACFYAMKYQHVHKQEVFGLPPDATEITRDLANSQTPEEIADLFRSSEAFYLFENSALGTESILCHCPTVLMPNPYLQKPAGLDEQDWYGLAWGNTEQELSRARATINSATAVYESKLLKFEQQLQQFIALTQSRAAKLREKPVISLPYAKAGLVEKFLRATRQFMS